MKNAFLLWFFLYAPAVAAAVEARPAPAAAPPTAAYVSDTADLPLRAGASNRHKIIGAVRNGSPVTVLRVDAAKAYSQIKTPTGVRGWLPNSQLTTTPGSQEQLAATRQELEQLKTRYFELQQHVDGLVGKPDAEAVGYPQLYEEALRLRQQLAQYRKVAADTVAVDERNKILQEQVVTQERDLQILQQQNQKLSDDSANSRLLMGVVLLAALGLVAVLVPRIRQQKRAQWSQL